MTATLGATADGTSRPWARAVRPLTAAVALTGLLVAWAAGATGAPAGGAGPDPPLPAGAAEQPALVLLARAVSAAQLTPYTGVQYVMCWNHDGSTVSMAAYVTHLPGQGTSARPVTGPGPGSPPVLEVDRTVDQLATGDVAAQAAQVAGVGGIDDGAVDLLRAHYLLAVSGSAVVADRPATVVSAWRPDGTLAARFYLDVATGLLLRRDLVDRQGRVERSSVFLSIQPGRVAPLGTASPAPTAWDDELGAAALAQMRRAGWQVPGALAGLSLYDARLSTGSAPVLQLAYSDGLSSVSVFEQSGRLDTARLGGWQRRQLDGATVWTYGALPQRVVWAGRGTVYTVVTDAPDEVVAAVVDQLPHGQHAPGVFARLWHGLQRIGSWLNPFS